METVEDKEGRRRVVNWSLCMLLMLSGLSCTTSKYTIYNISSTQKFTEEAIVYVEFKDERGKDISYCAVEVNGKDLYKTNEKNTVRFNITEGRYQFKSLAIGYAIEKTKRIKISKGDSLYLPMVLKLDTIPLVD